MKKPKEVIIQGHPYSIISDNSENCLENLQNKELRGCINYTGQVIYIAEDQKDESWAVTLLHEIYHAFLNHMGLKHEEKLVDNLATASLTFFKENEKLIRGLLK